MDINYYYIAAPFIAIYIWQFIAVRLNLDRGRPSWALTKIADAFTEGFQKLGRFAVYVSSFVEYVRLEMFYVPLFQLLKPVYDIAISWLWFFSAYAESAAKFTNEFIIYWGSFLLLYITTIVLLYVFCGEQIPIMWFGIYIGSIWNYIYFSFAITGVLFLTGIALYYIGIAVHNAIKEIWNAANNDNALLVERTARKQVADQKKQAAEQAFVDSMKK